MAYATRDQVRAAINTIRNERINGANSRERIADALQTISDTGVMPAVDCAEVRAWDDGDPPKVVQLDSGVMFRWTVGANPALDTGAETTGVIAIIGVTSGAYVQQTATAFGPFANDVIATAYAHYDFGAPSSCSLLGVQGNDPIANNWTVSGWTKALANGPDGVANATALTESGTANRWIQLIQANTLGPGWARMKLSYLPGAQYRSQRYYLRSHAQGGGEFLILPSADALRYPESDKSYTVYQTGTDAYYDGFKFTLRPDGWIDVQFDYTAHNSGTFGARLGKIDVNEVATMEALTGVAMTVSPVIYEQSRVDSVVPVVGAAESTLYQSTDSARPVLAPDTWVGGGSCLVEGYDNSCAMSGAFAGGVTWTVSSVVWVRQMRPTSTARTVLELTGTSASIKLQVNTTGKWLLSRTDDAAATATQAIDTYVAPVPVHVLLVHSGGSLTLYVDGVSAGSLSYASVATVTGLKIFGGNAKAWIRNLSAWARALSTAEIASVVSAQRSEARLPLRWPVVIHSGQSNAGALAGNTMRLSANGVFSRPGFAMFMSDYGYENTALTWLPGIVTNPGGLTFGARVGFAAAAQEHGETLIEINCARGGSAVTDWLTGGTMRSYLPAQVTAALGALGTSLYEVTDFTWIQGEAEANTADASGYLANLRLLRTWVRSTWGASVRFTLHRLNTWLGNSTADYQQANVVRTAQDAFWAEDPLTFMSRLDGGQWLDFNVHYTSAALFEVGRQLYLASRRKLPTVTLVQQDYPQRGTWGSTGAYWDAENGVAKTGSNVTTFTAREGGAVLTSTGTPTLATTWDGGRKCISMADDTAYMRCIDGTKWAPFGGTNLNLIVGIQFTLPALVGSKNVLNFTTSDIAHRQAWLYTSSTPTTFNCSGYSTGNTPTQVTNQYTIAANAATTLVYCVAASKRYVISSAGISAGQTDFAGAVGAPDRLVINAQLTSGGANMLLRRLGVKLAATSNPLAEAIALYTQLSALG